MDLTFDASKFLSEFFFPVDFRGRDRLRLSRRPMEKWFLVDHGRRAISEQQRSRPSVRFLTE